MVRLDKNILVILQSDYPPDTRVHKEMHSLAKAGYTVSILCDNRTPQPRHSDESGIDIYRLKHYDVFHGRLHRIINAPVYPNPVWLSSIKRLARRMNANALHVHDLPLAYSAIRVGKTLGIPVVLDLHENYPEIMKIWNESRSSRWTIRSPKIARYLEDICLQRADRIIVIDDEHKARLIGRGVAEEKIHVVQNTPYKALLDIPSLDNSMSVKYRDSFLLYYFGKINPERDLDVAIHALPMIKKIIRNVKFLIVGDGPHLSKMKKITREKDLEDTVEFLGWLDFDSAIPYFRISDICVIPHGSNDHLDIGAPNKLFEFMAFGKPVVVSESKASARIVRDSNCGEIFHAGSSRSFADAVLRVYNSSKSYGENGRNAIRLKYHWEITERALLRLYSELL